MARLVILAPLIALAAGCASYMSAQVTSFHQLTPERQFSGKRFTIQPTGEQKESLEFQAYAGLVRRALIQKGLADASGGDPDLGVAIRYTIDSGQPVTYSYPAYGYANFGPVWGWTPYPGLGGGVRYVWTATYPLVYGVVGTDYRRSVLYRRELRVEIADLRQPGSRRLFEGTAVTEGESASLAPVMPAMVRALFAEFPGPNGVTRVVSVRLDEPPANEPPPSASSPPATGPDDRPATQSR